jgi:hypothetical protein
MMGIGAERLHSSYGSVILMGIAESTLSNAEGLYPSYESYFLSIAAKMFRAEMSKICVQPICRQRAESEAELFSSLHFCKLGSKIEDQR